MGQNKPLLRDGKTIWLLASFPANSTVCSVETIASSLLSLRASTQVNRLSGMLASDRFLKCSSSSRWSIQGLKYSVNPQETKLGKENKFEGH